MGKKKRKPLTAGQYLGLLKEKWILEQMNRPCWRRRARLYGLRGS